MKGVYACARAVPCAHVRFHVCRTLVCVFLCVLLPYPMRVHALRVMRVCVGCIRIDNMR